MNILFVNYGDFTSNSLNHIGAFANRLTLMGHACVVAVPENPETLSAVHEPLFTPATFARALEREPIFPDRRPADLIHAWTPRENVREFVLAYLHRYPSAALIIHLEDNEEFLIESYAQEKIEALARLSDEELNTRLSPRLSHPVRYRSFLRLAHACTVITDRLREFVPVRAPVLRLLPGVDAALYGPQAADSNLREEIGLKPAEKVIVFTGSTTFANLADVRSLLIAVRLINERGVPCKLVRTGINPPQLARELAAIGGDYVIDLGFLEKRRLGALLSLADALVQPGAADAFNDYRLPSKIPEFMSAGRPVVIPRANLAKEMEDGRHALLLTSNSPEEIAERCLAVFADPALAERLSQGALAFARTHFDLEINTRELLSFYTSVKTTALSFPVTERPVSEDVLLASGDVALRFQAKERTIVFTRQLVAAREEKIAAKEAEVAARRADIDALQLELAAAQGTIAGLRQALDDAHAQKAISAAQSAYQHAKIQAARNQVEVLRAQVAEAVGNAGHFRRELDAAEARIRSLEAELRQRENKIARMRESFSWTATAPLRALRRALFDRLKRAPAQPAAAPNVVESGFDCSIDEPADWSAVSPDGLLRGWVLSQSGAAISAVRVRAGEARFSATFGITRPDVAASVRDNPHALRCGFALDYTLPAGTTLPVAFEALDAEGTWHCFAARTAHVLPETPEHLRRDYGTWVRRFDTLGIEQTVTLRNRVENLSTVQRPLISVVMPTYNTPERWLARAIESVRAQIYPFWQLCIADDASTAPHVRAMLEEYARRDERIVVEFRAENGHISAASNSALALARGEFVALLDHDDELAPHALAEVAFAIAAEPALEFIYSDEDKIDEAGRRFDPYFKPDWNPDLLLGQNYTCHLSVFRTKRIRDLGGFRLGYEGSQDWDLTLRATEGLEPARIRHIPRVLYHWRAIPGSTALVIDQKSNYPVVAAKKALADHLSRTRTEAELVPVAGHHWRLKRGLPETPPKVSLIIPTRNCESLLRVGVSSILAKTTYPDYEIVVVNNRSDDAGTLEYFEELRRLKVRIVDYDAPFNFSAINNFAVQHAQGAVLAFLNNDIEVITDRWLDEMVSQALRPEIGCVGAMLYYPDDTVQHAGAVLGLTGPAGRDGVAGHAFKCSKRGGDGQRNRLKLVQNYSAVTAACLVVRRDVFQAVGGFNERDLAVAFNDIDFCLRVLKAGYRNLWTPFAEFYHHESASRGLEDTPEKVARFQSETAYMRRTWGPLLDNDPAYNPNLSLQHEDFSLAFPPRRRA